MVISITEQDFSKENLKSFASSPLGDELKKAASKGDVNSFAQKHLSKEQKAQFDRIINDKEAMKKLLASPQAQMIAKMLKEK